MIKSSFLSIEETVNGIYVTFTINSKLYQGIVNSVPDNYEDMELHELAPYFTVWLNELSNNVSDEVKQEIKEQQVVEEIVNCHLLTNKDGYYYRLNSTVSLPKEIAAEYIKYQDDADKVQSLDNFWYYVCLNDDSIRNMLFSWLSKDEWKITKEGMIVAYRNVIYKETELDKFVKESYEKVKYKHKKNPYKYYVNKGEVLSLTKQETSLSLGVLYHQGKAFTHSYNSEYSNQPRLYYHIGKETSIDRSIVDCSDTTCSSGIHSQTKTWVENNGVNYFGDGHTLCVLISAMNVVSCPTEQGYAKLRSCAIFPVCEVEWVDGKIVEPDWSVIEKSSQEYNKESKIDIERFVNTTFEDSNPKFIGKNKEEIKERLIVTI